MANPWKYLIATGKLDELAGKKVEFKKFNSGSKVINAMASGDIDIAIAGSTPIAAGMSQGLDLRLIWALEIIGDAESLIVKENIKDISDLVGKKIGVPFGSTTHYHLLVALKKAQIDPKKLTILNLSPSSIVASWKKNEIDAAFVWSPALDDILKSGKRLLSSKDLAKSGDPTFDGIIVRNEFFKKNQNETKELLKLINDLHNNFNEINWEQNSNEVKVISDFIGASPTDVFSALNGYTFPNNQEQSELDLASSLKKTSLFLKEQGKIDKVLNTYEDKVSLELANAL
jgi:taurine transport system substrate-binding protein